MFRFVRIRKSHARRFVPGVKERRLRNARVGLLHEVLGLLARRDEPPRDAVDLVRELERLLLEAHAIARVLREPARVCLGFAHGSTLHGERRRPRRHSARDLGCGREPRASEAATISSRAIRSSSQESTTWPIRFAFAASIPRAAEGRHRGA